MNQIIEILQGIGWGGGFLFIFFRFLDSKQTDDEKEITRSKYLNIWQKIDQAQIQQLPRKVIQYLIVLFDKRRTIFKDIVDSPWLRKISSNWILFLFLLFMERLGAINSVDNTGVFAWIEMVATLFIGTQFGLFFLHRFKWANEFLTHKWSNNAVFIAASFYVSLFITTTVLVFENLAVFANQISSTIFLSDLVFDSFTLISTFYILNFCVKVNRSGVYFIGVVFDVLVAGVFAFLSLYVVTLMIEIDLEPGEILNLILFRSHEGVNWSADKWFWIVHSSFLPTVFYLGLILASLVGKAIILPVSGLFRKAGLVDKPHYLTANLFAFLGACSYGVAKILIWYIS